VWSGIIRGGPRFVPGNASIASEPAAKVTAIGWVGWKSPSTNRSKTRGGRHDASYLTTRQSIFEDGADVAPHRQDHDRPGDCGSAQGPCQRLPAAGREGFAR